MPSRGAVTRFTGSLPVTLIGGNAAARRVPLGAVTASAGFQAASSNPGRFQPGCSSRASYVSPYRTDSVRVGPSAAFQPPSLVTCWVLPSS